MERIKVSIGGSVPHRVQGSVSEFDVRNEFDTSLADPILDNIGSTAKNKILSNMECVEKTIIVKRRQQWKKIDDPRLHYDESLNKIGVAKLKELLTPRMCRGCIYSREVDGCVILKEFQETINRKVKSS